MDKGARQAIVHRVTETRTWLQWLSSSSKGGNHWSEHGGFSVYALQSLLSLYCSHIFNAHTLVVQSVKNPPAMQETWVCSLGWEDPLEKGMATCSSILAWKIPRTEEPGRLQSTKSQRVGHNWVTKPPRYFIMHIYFFLPLCVTERISREERISQVGKDRAAPALLSDPKAHAPPRPPTPPQAPWGTVRAPPEQRWVTLTEGQPAVRVRVRGRAEKSQETTPWGTDTGLSLPLGYRRRHSRPQRSHKGARLGSA